MTEPYGVSLFCDDIRYEANGKTSYIGVMGSTMEISKAPPILLPLFHIATTVTIPDMKPPKLLRFVVFIKTHEKEKTLSEIVVEQVDSNEELPDSPYVDATFDDSVQVVARFQAVHTFSPLKLESNCLLMARVFIDDDPPVKCGTLRVIFSGGVEQEEKLDAQLPKAS